MATAAIVATVAIAGVATRPTLEAPPTAVAEADRDRGRRPRSTEVVEVEVAEATE